MASWAWANLSMFDQVALAMQKAKGWLIEESMAELTQVERPGPRPSWWEAPAWLPQFPT